jgi:hypothetical protein
MPRPTRTVLVTLTGLSLLAAFSQATQADVYKYTDAQGKVQYTDKPKTLPAERIGLQSRRTDDSAVQEREEAERRRLQEADNQRRDNAAAADKGQANAAPAKDKTQVCNEAREQYAKYMSTQRMYESLPNGERRYLNAEELDRARATAKTAMDTLCK